MNTAISRKPTMFRLNVDLVERLKEMAKLDNRSLNNFVECILQEVVSNHAKAKTLAAIEEARSGKLRDTPPIDLSSPEAMFKTMGI